MESTACFIIPFFSNGLNNERNYLSETVTSIFKQTDDNWHIIIIDDASTEQGTKEFLTMMKELEPNKIDIILKNENLGQGVCRNDGIELARKKGFSYILFNDADDISNPNRVKIVREVFSRDLRYIGDIFLFYCD